MCKIFNKALTTPKNVNKTELLQLLDISRNIIITSCIIYHFKNIYTIKC